SAEAGAPSIRMSAALMPVPSRSALAALAVRLDLVVPAAVGQALHRDDALAVGGAEDGHALARAADDADLIHGGADHLPAGRDQQQFVSFLDREGGGQPIAGATAETVRRQPLPAPAGAPVLIGRGALAEAGLGDRQDELLR